MGIPTNLQQAAWRAVPFGVAMESGVVGRRQAIREYPYRDEASVEDMGKRIRKFTIEGFLISNSAIYGGGSAITQRQQMEEAAEQAGPGELVHPTLGSMQCNLLELEVTQRSEDGYGDYFTLRFTFVKAGALLFPTAAGSTGGLVTNAASNANSAAASDFGTTAGSVLGQGSEVVQSAQSVTSQWASKAGGLMTDASSIAGVATQLQGNYGRYIGGNSGLSSVTGSLNTQVSSATSAISSATMARANVTGASTTLNKTAADLGL